MLRRFVLCLLSLPLAAQIPFSQFVVFGDSLSDNGNLYIGTSLVGAAQPGPPLYATGEYTDGFNSVPSTTSPLGLWIEQLATKMNLPVPKPFLSGGLNYAVSSALTGKNPAYSPTSLSVPWVTDQLGIFQSQHATLPANSIYVFWAGANDILAGVSPTTVAANIQGNIDTLATAGAKYFLWLNLPLLGELPESINTSNRSALDAQTVAYQIAWTNSIAALYAAHPGITIVGVDVNDFFFALGQNPSLYGFVNITSPAQGASVNPNTYLFWDGLHPTTAGHALVSNLAYNQLQYSFGGPALFGAANAASGALNTVAPGMLTLLGGANIGPQTLVPGQLNPQTNTAATTLSSTQVFFNNIAAPLFYVQNNQTVAVAPYEIAGLSTVNISVVRNGVTSATQVAAVAPAAPGIFSANSTGSGPGAIYNQDLTLNTSANPAAAGTIVVLFGTGEGQTNPAGVDGMIAGSALPAPVLPVTVTIGGQTAQILYDGAIPGQVAGLFQINARVPSGLASGPQPVVVTVGTAASQAKLTVAVK